MAHYEIEIKSLLGEKANADALKQKMKILDPTCTLTSTNKQLNHYFHKGHISELYKKVEHLFSVDQHDKFKKIVEKGNSFSVRTRQKDDEVLLVVKASIDEGTSENTVSRLEFEEPVPIDLESLDQLVLASGYEYQAKWSREREEYTYKGANVCLDRNAGYGFLAEFEKIVSNESQVQNTRNEIYTIMAELGVEELSQERLSRMFEFYNNNWADYYGTEDTFIIE